MQTVSLTWQQAGELSAALAAVGTTLRVVPSRRANVTSPFVLEAAMIGFLYGLWQLCGKLSVYGMHDALIRARWIERFEHDVFLPSEHAVQKLILGHPLIVQTANLYYDTMHFTMMFVFLIWLFVRHRDQYRHIRSVIALTTLFCLLVQLIPVAPPRMMPGIVDTAMVYHQSVYQSGIPADQLGAMPSVHVAWGVAVGWYAARVSTSRWRWIAVVHASLTVFFVVATGNHWWLDGIVAVALLVVAAWVRRGIAVAWQASRAWRRSRVMPDDAPPPLDEPVASLI
jgi:hypothetical protein